MLAGLPLLWLVVANATCDSRKGQEDLSYSYEVVRFHLSECRDMGAGSLDPVGLEEATRLSDEIEGMLDEESWTRAAEAISQLERNVGIILEQMKSWDPDEDGLSTYAEYMLYGTSWAEGDTDGEKLEWGNVDQIMKWIRKIVYREGFGDILAEGCMRASEMVGRDSGYYCLNIKGQELYEPCRGSMAWALGAIVSTRGGGHTTGAPVLETVGGLDPEKMQKVYHIDEDGNTWSAGTMAAQVDTEDYGARTLYAMQSPEVWVEDFGTAQLVQGQAIVPIEPTFLQTINRRQAYHVFLTALGDCHGLYVADKGPNSFEVRELGGGTADVAFDYRIVAKRLSYEALRLESSRLDVEVPGPGGRADAHAPEDEGEAP